eukprot:COSAG01_NODE_40399_length_464_cov_0.838356_1_plen_27_part_10
MRCCASATAIFDAAATAAAEAVDIAGP